MEKQKIYVSNPADREQVAAVLFKNGYTVKLGKEQVKGRTVMSIEFWKGDVADVQN